jgi:hypothetical protein
LYHHHQFCTAFSSSTQKDIHFYIRTISPCSRQNNRRVQLLLRFSCLAFLTGFRVRRSHEPPAPRSCFDPPQPAFEPASVHSTNAHSLRSNPPQPILPTNIGMVFSTLLRALRTKYLKPDLPEDETADLVTPPSKPTHYNLTTLSNSIKYNRFTSNHKLHDPRIGFTPKLEEVSWKGPWYVVHCLSNTVDAD